ncbi:MAG: GNAT family N-acetyltransferase [Clostridia bacterium]|nr:GNAT family N-acetyltransferase [Clostridia bacterium]
MKNEQKEARNTDRDLIKRTFIEPPTIKTERLILRRMEKRDFRDMFEYASDPDVTRYLLWSPHRNERQTVQYLAYVKGRYKEGAFYDWAITDRETGKMIGTCGFSSFNPDHNSGEVGYVLNKKYWGCGIAAEALSAVIRFGFARLGLHRIEAKYMVGNEQSRRVMEKVGMKFEGIHRDSMFVKGCFVSVGYFAVLSGEWRK